MLALLCLFGGNIIQTLFSRCTQQSGYGQALLRSGAGTLVHSVLSPLLHGITECLMSGIIYVLQLSSEWLLFFSQSLLSLSLAYIHSKNVDNVQIVCQDLKSEEAHLHDPVLVLDIKQITEALLQCESLLGMFLSACSLRQGLHQPVCLLMSGL